MIHSNISTDFLVIGSGAAGLSAALHASKHGRVLLLTKSDWEESSSYWAQGGIAAVLGEQDSFAGHKQDTLCAGRGFCNSDAVDLLVEEGAREVKRYIDLGMRFDQTAGDWDLSLEGGHSKRRVLHANGAATGKALSKFLQQQVQAASNITVLEHAFVYQLNSDGERCGGASVHLYEENEILTIQSPTTILATGGYAGLFERSTNPHTSTGDGLWLGYRAGAVLQDLEFVQFHPTAFYSKKEASFLISEALRGEGARLYNQEGERFMAAVDGQELAPRDVVSQEIFQQIQHQLNNYVYLDVQHLDVEKIRSRFPAISTRIEKCGIDMKREGIPVAPAAHYCIGGVATDLDGQSSLKGLYACGEAAATGVHGANRLASNSLLECLVFSKRAVDHASGIKRSGAGFTSSNFSVNDENGDRFMTLRQHISTLLSCEVGICRDREGLERASNKIQQYSEELQNEPGEYFSLRAGGLLQLAGMITKAALEREESSGVHFRSDFPKSRAAADRISFQKPMQEAELI